MLRKLIRCKILYNDHKINFKNVHRSNILCYSNKKVNRESKKENISDVRAYLQNIKGQQSTCDEVPDRFLRVKNAPTVYSFIVDEEIASSIVEKIKSHCGADSFWIEINPGVGYVTYNLLKMCKKPLHLFDSLPNQLSHLTTIISENEDAIKIVPCNFFEIYKTVAQDKLDNGDRVKTFFSEFPLRRWEEEPIVKVFGILHSYDFISFLVRSIIFQDSFSKLGRMDYFLLVSEDVYKKIVKGFKSLKTSVLLSYFYDIKFLESYPRIAVLPWDKGKTKINDRLLYLMQLTPKPTIFKQHSDDELKVLWYFIQSLYRSKNNKVIAFFENWIPNSGLKLIKEGFHPMTEAKSLTVPEILFLFEVFVSHPDFDEASFIHIHTSGLQLEASVQETE